MNAKRLQAHPSNLRQRLRRCQQQARLHQSLHPHLLHQQPHHHILQRDYNSNAKAISTYPELYVLIDQDWISVWVNGYKTCRSCSGLVGFVQTAPHLVLLTDAVYHGRQSPHLINLGYSFPNGFNRPVKSLFYNNWIIAFSHYPSVLIILFYNK